MINRSLIRVKVLQVLYNFYHTKSMSISTAQETLEAAMESDYRVYLYLCGLPLDFSDLARKLIGIEEGKFSPDPDRLALLRALETNPVVEYLEGDQDFVVRRMATSIFHNPDLSELHEAVLSETLGEQAVSASQLETFDGARQFYRDLYGTKYRQSDRVYDILETTDAFVTDADLPVVFSFVTKFYNGLDPEKEVSKLLRPKFASKSDGDFGPTLLRAAIDNKEAYRERIGEYFKGWDAERVSEVDYLLMQMAMAEAIAFPTIATTVTINEYLNLAHSFSSENSYVFINGILFKLFTDLKEEGKIIGD